MHNNKQLAVTANPNSLFTFLIHDFSDFNFIAWPFHSRIYIFIYIRNTLASQLNTNNYNTRITKFGMIDSWSQELSKKRVVINVRPLVFFM